MKKILLDSSSAILLCKADLLARLIEIYRVSMAQSVLRELTRNNRYGADIFRQYAVLGKITVIDGPDLPLQNKGTGRSLSFLDQGELDTIKCFNTGSYDFIMVDDGRAARYCSKNNIAFINALLFPRLLYLTRCISRDKCNAYMEKIIILGRYSVEVIAWARNCTRESLLFAIPVNCGIDR